MILDNYLTFDLAANLAQPVGTYNSGNIIDLGSLGLPNSASGGGARDMGIGDDPALKLSVIATALFTSGGAATLAINFQGAPDNGAGSPGAYTTYASSQTYALAALIAGAQLFNIDVPRPPAGVAAPRFYRLQYVVGGVAFTAGTLESQIVLDRIDQALSSAGNLSGYPAGITVAN